MAWTTLWLRLQCLLLLCQCEEDEVLRKQASMPLQEMLTAPLKTWAWLISTNKTFSRRWSLCPQTADTIPGQQYRKEDKSCRCDDLRESRSRQPRITSSTPATDCTSKPLKLTQENFSKISLSWEWIHQRLWKYSHTRTSTVSLATEVEPRSDALESLGFLKHFQVKTNMEDPLTPWCFSIAHLLIYLGAGKNSPLLVGKYFCFFCIIDFYLVWLVCWLPICKMSWVPFLNASLVKALSWKCWASAGKGKGNSYLPRQKLHLIKRIVYLWFLFLYIFILPVFRKEFNYSNFIPNVLINKFDLT